jgi:hypothetical protein
MDWYLTLWLEPVTRECRFRIERDPGREMVAQATCVDGATREMAKLAMWELWVSARNATRTH